MKEVFYTLAQSIQADPISRAFTLLIIILFFIGCLPRLLFLSSYIHKKIPILAKAPKNLPVFIGSAIAGAGVGIYLSLTSWVFSVLIFVFFFIAFSPRFKKLKGLSVNPSLLTTVGILGTFIGIYMGLQKFNISNIDASIPELLRGLKIAFTTSIAGITGAILLKIVQSNIPNEDETENILDIFNNMYQILQNQFEQSRIQHKQILEKAEKNIHTQSKTTQQLYLKLHSLENSVKGSSDSINKSFSEIKHRNNT